jgi:hypothetical protein
MIFCILIPFRAPLTPSGVTLALIKKFQIIHLIVAQKNQGEILAFYSNGVKVKHDIACGYLIMN